MTERKPTNAELRLWLARVKADLAKGATPEEGIQVFGRLVECWKATIAAPHTEIMRQQAEPPDTGCTDQEISLPGDAKCGCRAD